ncbi:MAG TPA: hypothetical protein VEZ51_05680, partial [Gemmatimonadaceae bacterium]|nr:hypothetical protein [Gemmatimonadaceae bacterium]
DVGRELLVGWPTVKVVEGNKIVAAYIDRKLARDGYKGQQGKQPVSADRQDNLWKPASGAWSAHGRFDDIARPKSLLLRLVLKLNLFGETIERVIRPRGRTIGDGAQR